MNKPIIFLVIIFAFFASRQSMACSCERQNDQGFYSKTGSKILPSNAKGLLFTRFENEAIKPLKSKDFSIVDETNGKKISAKIVKLDLDFLPTNGRDYKATQTIYRIEPFLPFTQGHKYTFTFKRTVQYDQIEPSLTVTISTKPFSKKAFSMARFSFIDKAEIRTIRVGRGVTCWATFDALVQEIAYNFPQELNEFQDSILFFTAYSKDSKNFAVWKHTKSYCSPNPAGRSDYAFGHDLIYIADKSENTNQLERGVQYSIKGTWLAPEIEDKLHSSKEYPLSYPK